MVRDDAKFKPFAREVRRDLESVLAQYDIADKATLRQILGVLAQLDMLEGDYEAALARVAQVKALEEKPADKLLSGITTRAIVAGVHAKADRTSAAYRAEVAQSITAELAPLPYDVVANEVKEIKAGAELLGEGRLLGNVREVLQPVVDKTGSLSSDLAPASCAPSTRTTTFCRSSRRWSTPGPPTSPPTRSRSRTSGPRVP